MIYFFCILIFIGTVIIFPREQTKYQGYQKILIWWIRAFGYALISLSWINILALTFNLYTEDGERIVYLIPIFFFVYYGVCYGIFYIHCESDLRTYSIGKQIELEKHDNKDAEKISYRIVKNMYLMHPKDFNWKNDFYPLYKGLTFRMSNIDLLRFSFLYKKYIGNKVVSKLMLQELEKDMIKIQEDKEKSIQSVNKAANNLAGIMSEIKASKITLRISKEKGK